jgi:hypothetical protein
VFVFRVGRGAGGADKERHSTVPIRGLDEP